MTESYEDPKVAMGFGIEGLLNPSVGVQAYTSPPVAFNCKGWFATIMVSFPAKAFICGMTVTTTVSRTVFGQPSVSFTDRTYKVVATGLAVGVSVVLLTSVPEGLQVKDEPVIIPVSGVCWP